MHRKLRRATRPFRIAIVTTGGTIAKTYDQREAVLRNTEPVVSRLVHSLRLEGTKVTFRDLMHKDSLEIDDKDRARIVRAVRTLAGRSDAIVVIHGTDTLAMTGEALLANMPALPVPIILTGAIIPFVVQGSDGLQNVTEALFACRLLSPGVYAVFHGRALAFPGVVKDHDTLTFTRHSHKTSRRSRL
jgi:L-asparaginase